MTATSSFERTHPELRALIHTVRIVGLFGRYTYTLTAPEGFNGRVLVLHGDNGAGKTTILRLIWNLLSTAEDRGHRTFVAQTPFESMTIEFSDGVSIHCEKFNGLLGTFKVEVSRPGMDGIVTNYPVDDGMHVRRHLGTWTSELLGQDGLWSPTSTPRAIRTLGGTVRVQMADGSFVSIPDADIGPDPYIEFLNQRQIVPLMLSDDRTLHSDDSELARWRDRLGSESENERVDRVSAELRITLRRVTDWFRRLTIGGQNSGFEGANTIYRNFLLRLASPVVVEPIDTGNEADIHASLGVLGEESLRLEEFGLVPHFAAEDFLALLEAVPADSQQLARDILSPYLETLKTRYAALEHPERMLRSLVDVANEFLTDKRVSFNPQDGLTILTMDGTALDPEMLSSGERQLCTLLCTTILAGRDSRLFIIDEPELSLGVTWQRQVLSTLLSLTRGTALQFVVATHSIEIISGQPESLVRLVPERYDAPVSS